MQSRETTCASTLGRASGRETHSTWAITGHISQKVRHTFSVNDSFAYEVCIMTEFVGDVSATINSREISGSGWYNTCVYAGGGGFEIDIISEPKFWINPLGASGQRRHAIR